MTQQKTALEELETEKQQSIVEKQTFEQKFKELEEVIDLENKNQRNLQNQLDELKATLVTKTQAHETATKEIEQLKSIIATHEPTIKQFKEDLANDPESTEEDTSDELRQVQGENTELQTANEELTEKIENLERKLTGYQVISNRDFDALKSNLSLTVENKKSREIRLLIRFSIKKTVFSI